MRTWQDPHPPTPSRAVGISIGVVAILVLTIIAILAVTTDRAGANNYPPTTPEVTVPTTPETTVAATTTAAPPTTVPVTPPSNVPNDCSPVFDPQACVTTTVPVATTVPAPTTTEAPTTTVGEGTEAQEPEVIPPVVIEQPPAVEASSDTLPVTGASSGLVAVGLAVVIAGCVLVVGSLWRRSA